MVVHSWPSKTTPGLITLKTTFHGWFLCSWWRLKWLIRHANDLQDIPLEYRRVFRQQPDYLDVQFYSAEWLTQFAINADEVLLGIILVEGSVSLSICNWRGLSSRNRHGHIHYTRGNPLCPSREEGWHPWVATSSFKLSVSNPVVFQILYLQQQFNFSHTSVSDARFTRVSPPTLTF